MTAAMVALNEWVRTGPWATFPPSGSAWQRLGAALSARAERVREYYLYDGRGRRVGVITAPEPAGRPALGPDAPTVYLRRP